jgi:hypothetical protein
LDEYVIKEVVTFVRRGLDKVGKANAKVLRYPQRKLMRVAEIAFLLRRRNPCFHRIADRKRCYARLGREIPAIDWRRMFLRRAIMLLDLATVFFLVAGSLLLWLNIRNRPDDVVLTKFDNERLDN